VCTFIFHLAKVISISFLGQGRALPTELLPQYNTFYTPLCVLLFSTLPRSFPFPFWGKVVLYQLSYFRRKERAISAI